VWVRESMLCVYVWGGWGGVWEVEIDKGRQNVFVYACVGHRYKQI